MLNSCRKFVTLKSSQLKNLKEIPLWAQQLMVDRLNLKPWSTRATLCFGTELAQNNIQLVCRNCLQGPHGPWKSWKVLEFVKKESRPGKSLETDKVLESPGIFFQ